MHWHGLRIRNDMDGSPPDTQKPISPGGQFTYDFAFPTTEPTGTTHTPGCRPTGAMFGALVIEDPE